MILVSCETSDWGFGQHKCNLLKEILRIGNGCLHATCCVPLVRLMFMHPWNVSEKHWETTSTFCQRKMQYSII